MYENNCGMLVVTVPVGDRVYIGDPSSPIGSVEVHAVRDGSAVLTFRLPRDIGVWRSKLAAKILAGNDTRGTRHGEPLDIEAHNP